MEESIEEASTTTLVDKAYRILHEEIMEGRLGSGYPLLEQEIAERLSMSRTPVRVAIERLKHDGLVEIIRRKGILVKPLMATDVEQAYEVAEGLEGMLVKLIALRATDVELSELNRIVRSMKASADAEDTQSWAVYDKQFHQMLVKLARNPLIEASLARVTTIIERVRFLSLNVHATIIHLSTQEHLATTEALMARDGEKARQLHQAHWQRVRNEMVAFLRANLGRGVPIC